MRFLLVFTSLFATFESALAHPLGSEATVGEQLAHQALGVHHFPLLLLIVIVAIAVVRKLRKD